jgi:neutral amino acid transport system permease protein
MSGTSYALDGDPRPGPLAAGLSVVRRHPLAALGVVIALVALWLGIREGWHELAQSTLNGIVAGNYFALGAVGLTLIFGVLRLVNFAPGLALSLEVVLWRPVRRKRVGELQLLLLALGLAYVMRYTISFVAGPEDRASGADVTAGVTILGLRIGRTELIVTLVGLAAIVLVAIGLRYTSLGRQMRALADSIELSETTGIDTDRIVLVTWAISGGLAGLAGIIYALPAGTVNPQLGFTLILSIFAAVVVGGIGNAYGALAGGMLIGVAQEWSTLVINPSMKVAVGFAVLILVLLVRPQGLFGRARSVER